jgi:hypothetical protein
MEERFGVVYARSVARDYRLPTLGATADDALEAGVAAREVWKAICAEFEVPSPLH